MWYLLTDLRKLDLFTLFLCMSMCMWSAAHICAYCPPGLEESVKFPGPGVSDGCELEYRCWELNLHSLQEQVLLTTELSF